MTSFVIDARVAIDLAAGGATIPPEHSLAAPTLLRSQALALVYESVHRGEIEETDRPMDSERPKREASPNNSAKLLSVNVFRDRRICTRPIRSSV